MFASVSDVFPDAAVARVTGLAGVASGLTGILFPYMTGLIVDRFSYVPVFVMASLMPMIGILILFGTLGNYDRVMVSRPSSGSLQS
jgi:ACS family hexuronate transporter-like MFS transporter